MKRDKLFRLSLSILFLWTSLALAAPAAMAASSTALPGSSLWEPYLQQSRIDLEKAASSPWETLKSFLPRSFGALVRQTASRYTSVLLFLTLTAVLGLLAGECTDGALLDLVAAGGCGVPTIKPWNIDTIKEKMAEAKASGCFAVAMDVDAAGLPFLKNMTPPAGSKSVAELAEIVKLAERPFIVKGVMTVKGALKAKEAGAAAIVVSNHGGRVLDQCPATAEVLPEIAAALKGTGVKILVDGGIRTGVDVFKALALGADGVLICRPFVTAVYGGGEEGVKCYIDKLAGELADTMQMCGAHTLAEITPDMVRV